MKANNVRLLEVIDAISYENGIVSNQQAIENQEAELEAIGEAFHVLESDVCGWGSANAIIQSGDGVVYLARIAETE